MKGRLGMTGLPIKLACFVKSKQSLPYQKQVIKTSLYKEVNGTEPSTSLRVPWTDRQTGKQTHIHKYTYTYTHTHKLSK
jgi:hypothetical protein